MNDIEKVFLVRVATEKLSFLWDLKNEGLSYHGEFEMYGVSIPELPFFTPDLTNLDKLVNKCRVLITFS